VRYIFDINLST